MIDCLICLDRKKKTDKCSEVKSVPTPPISNKNRVKIYFVVIFFISSLISNLLEIFKEIFILAKQSPSSTYYIKFFISFPTAFLIMLFIQKSLNKFTISRIYSFFIISYAIFFFIFGTILLPYENNVQKGTIWILDLIFDGRLEHQGLKFLHSLIYIYGQWIYTIIYVLSEIWSSFMASFLVLGFFNYSLERTEMVSFLPSLPTITACTMISSATIYSIFNYIKRNISYKATIQIESCSFVCVSLLTMLIFWLKAQSEKLIKKEKIIDKKNLEPNSSTEGLWELLKSRFLRNFALINLIYAFNSGIFEASYKNSLSQGSKHYAQPVDQYSSGFINSGFALVACFILITNIFLYKKMKSLGWLFTSLVCPIISLTSTILISCLSFYNFPSKTQKGLFFNKFLRDKTKFLNAENWIVTFALTFTRVGKFVNFDIAKETLAVRISPTCREKYRSVFDGMCFRFGKCLSSLYGTFFTIFGITDIRQVAPITLVVLILTNYLWIKAVLYLNDKYQESIAFNKEIDVDKTQWI